MPPLFFSVPRRFDGGVVLLILLGALLCLARPVQAQFIGDRIRITTESGEKIIGELQGYDASSLALLAGSAEQRFAYADMAQLERSLGGRSRYWVGFVIGSSIGIIAGLIQTNQITATDDQVVAAVGISLAGGLSGLVLAASRRERWERLDIPGQGSGLSVAPTLSVHPTGRLTLGARISF